MKTKSRKQFVAYYRVSTDKQGASGLGLESQRKSVGEYIAAAGGVLADEFIEVESGRKSNRPELGEALVCCKSRKAVLIIAKLDRLARNVYFISGLMESGVDFVAVDMPEANKLVVHMMAAFAEFERDQISERTKAALERAKARGVELGKHGKVLGAANRQAAMQRAKELAPVIESIRQDGKRSLKTIADELNARKVSTPRGGRWHPSTVHTLLLRIDGRRKRRTARRRNSKMAAQSYAPLIKEIHKQGIDTVRGIADELNARGVLGPRGGKWHPASVHNLLKQI